MPPVDHNRIAAGEDPIPLGDWKRRHARLERRRSDATVREDTESEDDWEARHGRTKGSD